MRAIDQRFEVATPPVFWMQAFPIGAKRGKNFFVPDYLPILEEIQVYGTPFKVDGVHGL